VRADPCEKVCWSAWRLPSFGCPVITSGRNENQAPDNTLRPGPEFLPDRDDKGDFFAVLYFKFHVFTRLSIHARQSLFLLKFITESAGPGTKFLVAFV